MLYRGQIDKIYEYKEGYKDNTPDFEIFWFLNASIQLDYPEKFHSKMKKTSKMEWGTFDEDSFESSAPQMSKNIIKIRYKELSFIFGRVIDNSKLKRSFIRFERKEFPDTREIDDISLILSYLLGIELIYLGSTKFNSKSYPIERMTYSTLRYDINNVLGFSEIPPIPIYYTLHQKMDASEQINIFIKKYLEMNSKYDLTHVIWHLNYSRHQHPMVKIQPLAAAFDIICKNYCFEKDNILLPKKTFKDLLKEIKGILNKKELSDEIKKELYRRFQQDNNNSQNQRNKNIFNELGITLSENEKSALEMRNLMIHGSTQYKDIKQATADSYFFYTLINRLLLKVVGLQFYIDYSQNGGVAISPIEKEQIGSYQSIFIIKDMISIDKDRWEK
jgi:hypothetical protein